MDILGPELFLCPKCGERMDNLSCYWCAKDEAESKAKVLEIRKLGGEALGGNLAWDAFTAERYDVNWRGVLRPKARVALDAMLAFRPKSDGLYIFGPTGCGKTHLATIAARRFVGRTSVLRVIPPEISRALRPARGMVAGGSLADYVQMQVLLIDDLGVGKAADWDTAIYEVMDGRYMADRQGLLVTSNFDLDELAKFLGDDRIPSRLAKMCRIVDMAGEPDRRIS